MLRTFAVCLPSQEDILGVASQPLLALPATCKPFNKVVAGKVTGLGRR